MASFTEQATLRVVDQSSAQLRKINAELKKLFATAKSLKSFTINIKVNDSGLTKATAAVRQLATALRGLRTTTINIRANVSGLAAAQRQMTQLRSQAQRPISVRTQAVGGGPRGPMRPGIGGGGGGGPTRPGPHYGGGGYRRTPGSAFIGGVGGGIGAGLGRLNDSFGAVAIAGYAAAKALSAVAAAAQERDRTELAVDTQTSAAQKEVFKKLDDEAKARGDTPPALRYKTNQFLAARASFLGDVGNSDRFKTPEQLKSKEAQEERAQRADALARQLYRDVVPGMYARNPNLTQAGAQEELKKLVQTMGITTDKMFERNAQGQEVLSASANRVLEGISLAQRAAPDLTLAQIRTAAASIKSLGYTASPQQIAEILYNVSSKGQRAGNEAYQMYKTGLGVTDVGKLNNAINALGGFIAGTPIIDPSKKYKEGVVRAGTGIPVEFTDPDTGAPITLSKQPAEWWRQLLKQPIAQQKQEEDIAKQAAGALGPKASKKERQAAADAARKKFREEGATPEQDADFINRTLSGARGTALQGILDSILGGLIAKAGIAQAETTPGPREVETMMAERWSVQLTNLGTAVSNAAGDLGKLAAEAINLSGILAGMTSFVEENPLTSGAIAVGLGVAVGAAMLAPAGMLIRAAGALITAAGVMRGGAAAGAAGTAIGTVGTLGTVMRVGGVLMRVVGGVAVALTAAEMAYYIANRSVDQAKKDEEYAQAQKDLSRKEARAAAIEQERKVQEDSGAPPTPAMAEKLRKDAETLVQLKADIERLRQVLHPKPVSETEQPDIKPDSLETITAAIVKAVAEQQEKDRAAKDKDKDKDKPKKPEPKKIKSTAQETADAAAAAAAAAKQQPQPPPPPAPTPSVTSTAPTTPTPDTSTLAALIPQLAQTSQSITVAVGSLVASSSTFQSVFAEGATAIGNSGTIAAGALTGAAPGIGEAIGNSAATAIKAAVSNLSINVNANVVGGGKVDTGPQADPK